MFDAHARASAVWAPKTVSSKTRKSSNPSRPSINNKDSESDSDSDSDDGGDDDEDGEDKDQSDEEGEEDVEKEKVKAQGTGANGVTKDAGIKKIRMGTFQDTTIAPMPDTHENLRIFHLITFCNSLQQKRHGSTKSDGLS